MGLFYLAPDPGCRRGARLGWERQVVGHGVHVKVYYCVMITDLGLGSISPTHPHLPVSTLVSTEIPMVLKQWI